ncbi:MAG: DUF305 domain-containing protein [Methylobacteriaceae bacterium]|nr:DUF305 domain-containing protein [Methylobacteriaceae bacterium]
MTTLKISALALALTFGAAGAALAQGAHPPGHAGHGAPAANAPASTKAFQEANARMHKDMDIAFSGDADVDFVRGMIPHHQGAIDMAKVVLAHGKDAETKRLAQEIIAAQEKEIAWMKQWLAKRGK